MIDLDKIELLMNESLLARRVEKDHGLIDTRTYQRFTADQVQQLHHEAQTYLLWYVIKQLEQINSTLTVMMMTQHERERENGVDV